MKWYAEKRNIFGNYSSMTSSEYPADRNSDGVQHHYRVRVEIAPEHENLSLPEIVEIYGTKSG